MGVKQFIVDTIYGLVVWSGFINFLIDYVNPVLRNTKILKPPQPISNYEVVDSKGKKLKVCKDKGKVYPPFRENITEVLQKVRIRPDDILLCGYPKTGCHWTYEILYMLRTGRAEVSQRGKGMGGMIDAMPQIVTDSLRSPRVLNSHFLYDELPREIKKMKTKIILTTRNPKDTVVSFYNHHLNMKQIYGYDGEFPDYFKLFMDGKLDYGDYFDYWLDWERVMKTQKDNPIFVVSFEELKANTVKMVMEIAEFLETPISEKFAQDIAQACEFSKLKKKRSKTMASVIFRKGKVGNWKDWLTAEMSEEIDERWADKMKDCTYKPTM